MKKIILKLGTAAILSAVISPGVYADHNHSGQKFFTNENVGRIIGTSLGALVGSQIGGGSGRDMAIAAGALGGYIFGGKAGRNWNKGHNSGTANTGYLYPVQAMPELEHIDSMYSATKTSNVRGGPSTKYVVVGGLQPGEQVRVLGRVAEKNWYMVAQDDIVQGFVHMSLLQPVNQYYSYNTN